MNSPLEGSIPDTCSDRSALDEALFADDPAPTPEEQTWLAAKSLVELQKNPAPAKQSLTLLKHGSGVYELQTGGGTSDFPEPPAIVEHSHCMQVQLPPPEYFHGPEFIEESVNYVWEEPAPAEIESKTDEEIESQIDEEPSEPTGEIEAEIDQAETTILQDDEGECEIVVAEDRLEALPEEWTPASAEQPMPLLLKRLTPLVLASGDSAKITTEQLEIEGAPSPFLLDIMLLSPPEQGVLLRDGFALTGGDIFTQEDIDRGRISYRHESEATSDQFSFATPQHEIAPTVFRIEIHQVRRPPELLGSPRVKLTAEGLQVGTLLAGQVRLSETGILPGIAIVESSGRGRWEFSVDGGSSWQSVGEVSNQRALLLQSEHVIRFVPQDGWGGKAQLSYRAWDSSCGDAGLLQDLGTLSALAISEQIATLSSLVSPAPLRLAVAEPWQRDLSLEEVVGEAAAVIRLEGAGVWQFSLDDGASWHDFGPVYHGRARLLRASDRIRFMPRRMGTGRVVFSARPWNGTTGEPGSLVNLSGHHAVGGDTPFGEVSRTRSWRLGVD